MGCDGPAPFLPHCGQSLLVSLVGEAMLEERVFTLFLSEMGRRGSRSQRGQEQ